MDMILLLGEAVAPTINFDALKTALTSSITPDQILAIIASTVGIGMTFFLMWFGVRKLTSAFTASLKSGKIKV